MGSDVWAAISAVVASIALLLSIWNSVTARGRKDFANLSATSDDHGRRLTQVEATMKHIPDSKEFGEMRLAMETLKGQMNVIAERVEPIKAIAERLQETLLERSK